MRTFKVVDCVANARALAPVIAAAAPRITISSVRAERRELERELSAGTLDAAIDVLLPLPEEVRRERLGTVAAFGAAIAHVDLWFDRFTGP